MASMACKHEIFENHMRFGRDIRLLNISAYAQQAMKLFLCMLSNRLNRFRVSSACDEIISALAQHAFGCPCKNCQNLNAG
jgi:hypothetical protein